MKRLETSLSPVEQPGLLLPDRVKKNALDILAAKQALTKELNSCLGFSASSDLSQYHQLVSQTATFVDMVKRGLQIQADPTLIETVDVSLVALLSWGETQVTLDVFEDLRRIYNLTASPIVSQIGKQTTGKEAYDVASQIMQSLPEANEGNVAEREAGHFKGVLAKLHDRLCLEATSVATIIPYVEMRENAFRSLDPCDSLGEDEEFRLIFDQYNEQLARKLEERMKEEEGTKSTDSYQTIKKAIWEQLLAEKHNEVIELSRDLSHLKNVMGTVIARVGDHNVPPDLYGKIDRGGELRQVYELVSAYVLDRRRKSGQTIADLASNEIIHLVGLDNWAEARRLATAISSTTSDYSFLLYALGKRGVIDTNLSFAIEQIEAFQQIAWLVESVAKLDIDDFFDRVSLKDSLLAHHLVPFLDKGFSVDLLFSILEDGLAVGFMDEVRATYAEFQELLAEDKERRTRNTMARAVVLTIVLAALAAMLEKSQPPLTATVTPTPTPTATQPIESISLVMPAATWTPTLSPSETPISPQPVFPSTPTLVPEVETAAPVVTPEASHSAVVYKETTPEDLATPVPKGVEATSPAKESPSFDQGTPVPETETSQPIGEVVREIREEVEREVSDFVKEAPEAIRDGLELYRELRKKPEFRRAERIMEYLLLAWVTATIRRRAKRSYAQALEPVAQAMFTKDERVQKEFFALMSLVSERPAGLKFGKDVTMLFIWPLLSPLFLIRHPYYWIASLVERVNAYKLKRGYQRVGKEEGLERLWQTVAKDPAQFLAQVFGFNKGEVEKALLLNNLLTQSPSVLEHTEQAIEELPLDDRLKGKVRRSILTPFGFFAIRPFFNPSSYLTSSFISGDTYLRGVEDALIRAYKDEAYIRTNRIWRLIHHIPSSYPPLVEDSEQFVRQTLHQLPGCQVLAAIQDQGQQINFWDRMVFMCFRPRHVLLGWKSEWGEKPKDEPIYVLRRKLLAEIGKYISWT